METGQKETEKERQDVEGFHEYRQKKKRYVPTVGTNGCRSGVHSRVRMLECSVRTDDRTYYRSLGARCGVRRKPNEKLPGPRNGEPTLEGVS